MSIITPDHVHSRNWMKCPSCEGRVRTEREIKLGYQCVTCENVGEVPRKNYRTYKKDNSSYYEKLAGA